MTTTTDTTPEAALVAIRWGFANLDDLTGRVPERLRAYAEQVITSSSFRRQIDRTLVTVDRSPRGMNRDEIADRLTQECARLDARAIKETETRARWEQAHRCAVTGQVDGSTEGRVAPWGGDRIVCSARGYAILVRAWIADATPAELTAARALLPKPATTEQPTPKRRRSA